MSLEMKNAALTLVGTEGTLGAWYQMVSDLLKKTNLRMPPGTEISYEDIVRVGEILRSNVNSSRDALLLELSNDKKSQSQGKSLNSILDIGVQAVYMTDSRESSSTEGHWKGRKDFAAFMDETYPEAPEGKNVTLANQSTMRAWKLVKKLGIKLRGTENLADHLMYIPASNTVYFFHHVAFLHAHLEGRASNIPIDSDMRTCLEKGTLPPLLLMETLHSLQVILFPSLDTKAQKLLDRLTTKQDLDPECYHYAGHKREDYPFGSSEAHYRYWGERVEILQDLLHERPPRTRWEKWLRWQSSEENAYAIAIIALSISILVGLISIALSAIQIWVSWMAWKHPVQ